ncbi:MAG: Asp-tRNA(Asn)/Glu-tRNA(Gln) amidotransferase subunit GatA [Proteobacteria bacterium]|nr:Asp-tRNA(Asn)/Glu-tRNA(Gln) amidotransferase subunit GatA [Pseudomonadota bacterium]
MDLLKLSIPTLAKMLREKKISSQELVSFYLERIKKHKKLNAYITVLEDAVNKAKDIDMKGIKNDDPVLRGIPYSLKDNMLADGVKTTCASRILENYIAGYDSTIAKRLKDSGAVLLGKTNMDEFAMGSSNENSHFGPVCNPWNEKHVAGGSSGGSAVSVSAGLSQFSYGTDTGGSVRLPASFNGVASLKPTYGRMSRYGIIAFASSLDQIGPIAKNIEDLAIAYDVVSGHDPKDSTTSIKNKDGMYEYLIKEVKDRENNFSRKTVGIPRDMLIGGCSKDVLNSLEQSKKVLTDMGFDFVDIDLPNSKYALAVYYIIVTGEASSNLSRYDGVRYGYRTKDYEELKDLYSLSRGDGFGDEVRRRIILGTFVLSAGYYDAYFSKAAKVRSLIKKDFEKVFEKCDSILMPVSPVTAFKIGERTKDPLEMYLSDIFTVSANLAAVPSLGFPAGRDSRGLPIGMQLIGKHFDEKTLFTTAWMIQKQKPEWFNNIATTVKEKKVIE